MKQEFCTLHKMHCSSSCMLRVTAEDGRISRISSAGDIPREGSREADESLFPIQRRACCRGLSEWDHNHSPDRLTVPLLQTGERGDPRGFRAIGWEEAIERSAAFYQRMRERSKELGYLPVLEKGGVGVYLGPCMETFGNSSSGNADAAIRCALGEKTLARGHPPIDLFNTHYLIIWSSDPTRTLPYLSFTIQKAREQGIPITVVDTRYTDAAAAYATGYGDVPGTIVVRPGTDGAMMAAMANVIYRNRLHDEGYVRDYCFGFYPNDTVVSRSCGKDPVTGKPFYGEAYRVPPGESFVEYLDGLEAQHGGYQGVLRWAAQTTGVQPRVIEAFAKAYAAASPAFLFSRYNGGAQRSYNGMYFSWMMIALSAMTGNLTRRGGGFGELSSGDGFTVSYPAAPSVFAAQAHRPILVSQFETDRAILTGLDGRTARQLREDVLAMNGIDLGENARLCVEGWVKGARNGDPFNQNPHCNLRRIAWRKLSFVLTFERHLTPTAAWSDLVLPAASMFESGRSLHQPPFGASDTFVIDGPLPPPGEAKTDGEICRLLARALSIPLNEEIPDEQVIRAQWERARLDPEFLRLNPDSRLPSYQELLESADFQCPVRPEDTKPMVSGYLPGEFPTETGKINFYSPFAAARQRSAYGAYRACYQPLEGGAEAIDAGLIGNTGERYTLQFVTPHVITKADASFDNTATLRALLPNAIGMHPQDAVDRGLKEGQTAYLYNDYGCIKLPVHVSVTVARGVVTLPHGAWHRPSRTERYRACFDADFDGAAEWHEVPVDVGGNSNTVTGNRNSGLVDPFIVGMGLNSNGYACEVSPQKPERGEKP